ncbi:MAG: AMP-binding protein, partial [Ignavibacteriaceae bacterium]
MKFFSGNSRDIFLIDHDHNKILTYSDAEQQVKELVNIIRSADKKLAFLFCEQNYQTIIRYLALLEAGHTVLLLDGKLNDEIKRELILTYLPEIIFSRLPVPSDDYIINDAEDMFLSAKNHTEFPPINEKLAVLLSTSGTTGSPKLVRLSYSNLESNAASIISYLNIKPNDRA